MSLTIREIIKEKSDRLRNADTLTPDEAADTLVELSSLLSSLNAEIVDSNYWYNVLLDKIRQESKSAVEAKIKAQATAEWKNWQERVAQGEALQELIRAVKYFIRRAETEYKG